MEETLTLTRVIENINYVYGGRLVKAIIALFIIELIVFFYLRNKAPEIISKFKLIVMLIAIVISTLMVLRAQPYVGYEKFQRSTTTCSAKYLLNQKDYDEFSWADYNIYRYHYYKSHPDELKGIDFQSKFGADAQNINFDEDVLCGDDLKVYGIQILACLLIYIMGFFLTLCVFENRYPILSAFLAAPIGAAVVVVVTILLLFFHIKYSWISVLCCWVLILVAIAFYIAKKKMKITKTTLITIFVALGVIAISTYVKFFQFSGDSRWQLILAMNLVDEGGFSKWVFSEATTFGFFGISLHAFALLFGSDFLYAYFALMGLSGLGIFFSSAWILLDKENRQKGMLFLLIGVLVLLANFDFEYYSFSVLSNASMGVCLLSIVVLTLLSIYRDDNVTILLTLITFVLLTTRVEGVCYVVLFMSVPLERKDCLKITTIIAGAEIILWQITQFIYSSGTGVDGWTPQMGLFLTVVGLMLMIVSYLDKQSFLKKLISYYKIWYIVLLALIIAMGFSYDLSMAKDNLVIFLSHLAVSKYSNSLSLWVFLLYLLPFAAAGFFEDKNNILILCPTYFLMVFGISIFRTGNPLNTEISDSFRRIICQMMLMSTWLILYYGVQNEGKTICRGK